MRSSAAAQHEGTESRLQGYRAFGVQGRSEEGSTTSSFALDGQREDELQLHCFRVTSGDVRRG